MDFKILVTKKYSIWVLGVLFLVSFVLLGVGYNSFHVSVFDKQSDFLSVQPSFQTGTSFACPSTNLAIPHGGDGDYSTFFGSEILVDGGSYLDPDFDLACQTLLQDNYPNLAAEAVAAADALAIADCQKVTPAPCAGQCQQSVTFPDCVAVSGTPFVYLYYISSTNSFPPYTARCSIRVISHAVGTYDVMCEEHY
ncbi:MAG: hypothetical protein Q8P57_00670 [Candidatus Pacearchaeota archaeon]|nr:hypothetical protein [Candidatus Pacearchaeota archaeon]